ncbi:MAG: beta-ketoacyl-[acyl-carrier-protein] synthase family protein [Cypionkella sp.]
MARVVITGAGTVNPLGHDVASTFAAMGAGRSAIGPLNLTDLDRLHVKIAAQVTGWKGDFDRSDLIWMDPFAQYAVTAARQAMAQAGLGALPEAGVILGSAGGGLQTVDDSYRSVYQLGKNRVHPFTVPRLMASAGASLVARDLGLLGPSYTVASACSSSNHAIGQAFQMVRMGQTPVMLAGGSDAMLCFGGIKAWEGLRVLSETACRPFSKGRDGMVMGEGAAVFVLEDRDHALARGAVILAEIAGFSMTSDAGDMVQPSIHGAVRAMQAALRDAKMSAAEVGYINAHGTGTVANDRCEAHAIAEVFQGDVLVSSTKSLHGHLIGGAGAVELLACLLALQEGVIAPTAGYLAPDPECPVNLVTQQKTAAVTAVLSNSFAFGGLNAVLALRKA